MNTDIDIINKSCFAFSDYNRIFSNEFHGQSSTFQYNLFFSSLIFNDLIHNLVTKMEITEQTVLLVQQITFVCSTWA